MEVFHSDIVLAKTVKIIHILLVLFIVITPLRNFIEISHEERIIYFWISTCIIIHWLAGSTTCFLTILETRLLNIPEQESFIFRIISPIYDISKVISDTHFRLIVRYFTIFLWSLNLFFIILDWQSHTSLVKYFLLI